MAQETRTLTLQRREKAGSTHARAVRAAGQVPGVLYGHGEPPLSIAVDARALADFLHKGKQSDLIEVALDGTKDTARIRTLEREPISRKIVSVDLQRVSRTEAVSATLQIVTVGVPRGVKDMGGVLDIVTHAIDVMGPADSIPDAIRVDVTELGLHQHISAKDLALPPGFKLYGTPPDQTIVAVEASKTEKQAEADLSQAEPAPVAPVAAPETTP